MSHSELLALKIKRVFWDEDAEGNIKRVQIFLNNNTNISCGDTGMYFPKKFEFEDNVKIQLVKIQRAKAGKLCTIEFCDTTGRVVGVIGTRSFGNECAWFDYSIEPNE